ncbi:MAG: methyltransferase domain-containing protein [Clostridia bacterium]|nr:methyltransferase domain-containing protein [Clostridia bacterium]MBQ7184605.1 methyltransferase domain-containing protein [Clostridia bacterium]
MFWDRVAGVYDIFVNVVNRKTHRELKRMIAGLIGPEDEVLECACGTGLLSAVIAGRCRSLTATDFSEKMLAKARKNCAAFRNVSFAFADITALGYPDGSFDKAVAGNVIHLLDEPLKALAELNRVCRPGGTLIIPTYMNRDRNGRTGGFAKTVGKAGADFKRQFTVESYRQFFLDAGYRDVRITVAEGRIPCAVAVMQKKGA